MARSLYLVLMILLISTGAHAADPATTVTVYKSASCGCCGGWVDYLRDNGFQVDTHDTEDLSAIKQKLGLLKIVMPSRIGIRDNDTSRFAAQLRCVREIV